MIDRVELAIDGKPHHQIFHLALSIRNPYGEYLHSRVPSQKPLSFQLDLLRLPFTPSYDSITILDHNRYRNLQDYIEEKGIHLNRQPGEMLAMLRSFKRAESEEDHWIETRTFVYPVELTAREQFEFSKTMHDRSHPWTWIKPSNLELMNRQGALVDEEFTKVTKYHEVRAFMIAEGLNPRLLQPYIPEPIAPNPAIAQYLFEESLEFQISGT